MLVLEQSLESATARPTAAGKERLRSKNTHPSVSAVVETAPERRDRDERKNPRRAQQEAQAEGCRQPA